jgi:hypothetical protein
LCSVVLFIAAFGQVKSIDYEQQQSVTFPHWFPLKNA